MYFCSDNISQKIMKKIALFVAALFSAMTLCAQIPPASPAACAECGVKNGEPHKSWCPYAPQQEPEEESEPAHYSDPVTPPAPTPTAPPASHYTAPTTASTAYVKPDFSMMSHPTVQPRPLFSGINEQNLTVAPTELTSQTQWGEVDLKSIGSFTYDICRYSHYNNTAVVLGHTHPNGAVEWKILKKYPYGYYNEWEFADENQEGVSIVNVHFEAEGNFIFMDYSDGTNRVLDAWGNMCFVSKNNEVRLLDFRDGNRYFFEVWDRESSQYLLWTVENRERQIIGISKKEIQYFDNAFVTSDFNYTIRDYNGEMLSLNMDGRDVKFFDDVTAYQDDVKWHFVITANKWGTPQYAIVTSDLKQYGGWYATIGELQQAWANR